MGFLNILGHTDKYPHYSMMSENDVPHELRRCILYGHKYACPKTTCALSENDQNAPLLKSHNVTMMGVTIFPNGVFTALSDR